MKMKKQPAEKYCLLADCFLYVCSAGNEFTCPIPDITPANHITKKKQPPNRGLLIIYPVHLLTDQLPYPQAFFHISYTMDRAAVRLTRQQTKATKN